MRSYPRLLVGLMKLARYCWTCLAQRCEFARRITDLHKGSLNEHLLVPQRFTQLFSCQRLDTSCATVRLSPPILYSRCRRRPPRNRRFSLLTDATTYIRNVETKRTSLSPLRTERRREIRIWRRARSRLRGRCDGWRGGRCGRRRGGTDDGRSRCNCRSRRRRGCWTRRCTCWRRR
jgi:hypothetical protein